MPRLLPRPLNAYREPNFLTEVGMEQLQKQTLQVAKEIVVKFIEIGRISPNNFDQFFSAIYNEVLRTFSHFNGHSTDQRDE